MCLAWLAASSGRVGWLRFGFDCGFVLWVGGVIYVLDVLGDVLLIWLGWWFGVFGFGVLWELWWCFGFWLCALCWLVWHGVLSSLGWLLWWFLRVWWLLG